MTPLVHVPGISILIGPIESASLEIFRGALSSSGSRWTAKGAIMTRLPMAHHEIQQIGTDVPVQPKKHGEAEAGVGRLLR